MTEENNIEQEIIKQFHQLAKENPFKHSPNWNSFFENPDNIKNIDSIKIEIDYNLNLENWNFNKLNFEFLITKNCTISFQNCQFKSLKIIGYYFKVALHQLILYKCTFTSDVEINIEVSSLIFLNGSKFYGNKCIINSPNYSKEISLNESEFGKMLSIEKNVFELQIFSNQSYNFPPLNPDEWTKFSAWNFILKTNIKEIYFKQYKFNVNKLVIEGVIEKQSNVIFGSPGIVFEIAKEIELKNLNTIVDFYWYNDYSLNNLENRKLSFLNVANIDVGGLKNIDLSGSVESIKGTFLNCNFKNISGEINAIIFNETTFENCENIKKIVAGEVHKITIKSSKISEEIYLKNCDLLKIEDSKINKITLENCQFNDAIILNGATFSQSPHISNIKFSSHNVEMRNLKFDDNLSPQASGSYRALMKVCQDAGYENGVIFFHVKELETRHNYLKNNIKNLIKKFKIFSIFDDFIEAFLLFFYNYFSKYGASLFRPLFWIISFFVISISCCVLINNGEFNLFFSLIDLSKLSFKNSLGPLIFALPKGFIEEDFVTTLPSSIKILCFLQTVICSSTWFVWFFMVRRRFKI